MHLKPFVLGTVIFICEVRTTASQGVNEGLWLLRRGSHVANVVIIGQLSCAPACTHKMSLSHTQKPANFAGQSSRPIFVACALPQFGT